MCVFFIVVVGVYERKGSDEGERGKEREREVKEWKRRRDALFNLLGKETKSELNRPGEGRTLGSG